MLLLGQPSRSALGSINHASCGRARNRVKSRERFAPGPDFAAARPKQRLAQQADLLDLPSRRERALRLQGGQLIAAQVVEDKGMLRIPRGAGAHHTYLAALKRVLQKVRTVMSLAKLEATVAWLERSRLSDHLHLLEGYTKYARTIRQRRRDLGSGKRPRVRATSHPPLRQAPDAARAGRFTHPGNA